MKWKRKPKHISQEDWDDLNIPELTKEDISKMRPTKEVHPDIPARVRGPQRTPTKVPVSLRLSKKVVDYFRAQGKGWQTKIDNILHDYVEKYGSDQSK
jgi:uncharacterized protein (DUF4415 family)